jgi:glycosyltransferase involved in cell wall biosynthesis
MLTRPISLSVVVPALNEEVALNDTIKCMCKALNDSGIDWEIILINDGSTDRTQELTTKWVNNESRIKAIHHQRPMGVGYCFREGIEISTREAITWLPADGENDPGGLLENLPLLEQVDMVIPFVLNTGIRHWTRRILSKVYLWIINVSFGTRFNYTNGNVIYRREIFKSIKPKSNGFFYQAECLIRGVHAGFTFIAVPVQLRKGLRGRSKALSLKSFSTLAYEFMHLFYEMHIKG